MQGFCAIGLIGRLLNPAVREQVRRLHANQPAAGTCEVGGSVAFNAISGA